MILHNSGYYQPGMTALLRDMYAFDRLSGRKATNAHRHLEECGIQDMSWICVEWFQTVYSVTFPQQCPPGKLDDAETSASNRLQLLFLFYSATFH
mmetsp:Transcript_15719/g.15505  ORF Transcript_15719/g.15505 Transcript_15719/m.15505 type:complete len:95 (-) Transcript_15719:271-555(-)